MFSGAGSGSVDHSCRVALVTTLVPTMLDSMSALRQERTSSEVPDWGTVGLSNLIFER